MYTKSLNNLPWEDKSWEIKSPEGEYICTVGSEDEAAALLHHLNRAWIPLPAPKFGPVHQSFKH